MGYNDNWDWDRGRDWDNPKNQAADGCAGLMGIVMLAAIVWYFLGC